MDPIKQIYIDLNNMNKSIHDKFIEIDLRMKKIENAILYIEKCINTLNNKSMKQTRYLKQL